MVDQKHPFDWQRHPEAEQLLINLLDEACRANQAIALFKDDLYHRTSTRLFDWLDHISVGTEPELEMKLGELGFEEESAGAAYRVYRHPGAQLPSLIVEDTSKGVSAIAVKVENIADFLMVRGMPAVIEGTPFARYRRCQVNIDQGVALYVIERRGTRTMEPTHQDGNYLQRYLEGQEAWKRRPRDLEEEDEAICHMLLLAERLVAELGTDTAAWLVLECERDLWQARNKAAQIQKARQDRLGMGWANHDHHTFRSSRRHFTSLVRLFEILGFHCRERYYAGEEAGWGAQVMENSTAGLILFLDTDLTPEELDIDFAHQTIPEIEQLGTVGLWCELHGDSILKAGMHHLEAQFFFDELRTDLQEQGVQLMEPFSNFTYLKQAFTQAEHWQVDPRRVEKLLSREWIGPEQAEQFLTEGAVGSHLENLQRRDGYKGFNQKNVSFIIKKTDPRLSQSSGTS